MVTQRAEPSRPIQSALKKALLERLQRLKRLMEDTASESEQFKGPREEFVALLDETERLLGWVNLDTREIIEADAVEGAKLLGIFDYYYRIVEEGPKVGWRKPRGRPATKRQAAIRALELQLENEKAWPWRKIVKEFCDCTKAEHDQCCEESMKAAVRRLKQLLRKYAIDLKHV